MADQAPPGATGAPERPVDDATGAALRPCPSRLPSGSAAPLPTVDALRRVLAARGIALPAGPLRVDAYGDSPALSRALIALIRAGRKRAGTALLWSYEADGEPLPQVGDLEIVVDDAGEPMLLTRVRRVEVCAFDAVDAAYAAVEGEGDRSLASWRAGHFAYFSRECARLGRTPAPDMPVVCCEFDLLADWGRVSDAPASCADGADGAAGRP